MLLSSLLENWNTLVVSLGNSTPKGKVTLAIIRNSLFKEEIRKNDFVANDTHALVTENKGRNISKGLVRQNKSRGKSKFEEKIKCYHCGKSSHMKINCKFKTYGVYKS